MSHGPSLQIGYSIKKLYGLLKNFIGLIEDRIEAVTLPDLSRNLSLDVNLKYELVLV